jgi:hypothetical protein
MRFPYVIILLVVFVTGCIRVPDLLPAPMCSVSLATPPIVNSARDSFRITPVLVLGNSSEDTLGIVYASTAPASVKVRFEIFDPSGERISAIRMNARSILVSTRLPERWVSVVKPGATISWSPLDVDINAAPEKGLYRLVAHFEVLVPSSDMLSLVDPAKRQIISLIEHHFDSRPFAFTVE